MRALAAATAGTSSSCLAMSSKPALRWLAVVAVCGALGVAGGAQSPRFYPDDPIAVDDDMAIDASAVTPIEDSNGYDFVVNTFAKPGMRHDVRAGNVNTIDEVP